MDVSILPSPKSKSNNTPFLEVKASLEKKIKASTEKQSLFDSKNLWSDEESRDKRLEKYGNDCAKQRLACIHKSETTPLPMDQVVEMDLIKQIQRHRHQAINRLKVEKVLSPKQKVAHLQSFSNNMREEQKLVKLMAEERKQNEKTFWKPKDLPGHINPSNVYPTKSQLINETAFGKPNILKSYTVIPAMQSILCPLFKSGYVDTASIIFICHAIPNAKFLLKKIQEYAQWDFRCLRHPNFDWESKSVNNEREKHREACLIYYDCSIEAVQRYCGGRFTGDHRRVQEMLLVIKPILTEETFKHMAPGYINGVPNFFHADVSYSEFQLYKANATQKNIDQHPKLVHTQLVKEDAKDLSLIFDGKLVNFLIHCGIIPVGSHSRKEKGKIIPAWFEDALRNKPTHKLNCRPQSHRTRNPIW
jgi:hypothetical protein